MPRCCSPLSRKASVHIEVDQEVLAAGFDPPGLLSVVFEGRNIHLIPITAISAQECSETGYGETNQQNG